jgi:hypothetical protein
MTDLEPCQDAIELRKLLRADFDAGHLFWLKRDETATFRGLTHSVPRGLAIFNGRYADRRADGPHGGGYRMIRLFYVGLLAHRVLWLLKTGQWPEHTIDHINGVRDDNRMVNLRDVPFPVNARNTKRQDRNTTGVCGVFWSEAEGRFKTYIDFKKKRTYLGTFKTLAEAAAARKAAEVSLGFHENHGRD